MEEYITVVVPVYNKAQFLERCVNSILSQTFNKLEVLLIDDGSTDDSGRICDEFAIKDNRVRVIHKKNGGASEARNVGIAEAKGEYVGFIDADDYIENDMYEKLYNALKNHPNANISQIMALTEDENGNIVTLPLKDSGEVVAMKADEFLEELLLHKGDSSFCSKLFISSFIKNYRFAVGELNEDFELLLRMMNAIGEIVTVEQKGYHIVLSSESNTRGNYRQSLYEDMMRNVTKARKLVDTSFPEFKEQADKFELTQCLDFLLHVPVERMTADNMLYNSVKRIVKASKNEIKNNPYFDDKQRKNLWILSHFPMKTTRVFHRKIMMLRGK